MNLWYSSRTEDRFGEAEDEDQALKSKKGQRRIEYCIDPSSLQVWMYMCASTREMSGGPQLGVLTDGIGLGVDWPEEPRSKWSERLEARLPGRASEGVDNVGKHLVVVWKSILLSIQLINR